MKKKFTLFLKVTIHLWLAVLYLPATHGQIQSKPADKFVDMIGVCVHAARNNTQYTNSTDNPNGEQNTINAISNLRIRHLRDGIYGWNGTVEDFDMNNRGVVTRFSAISQAGVNAGIPGGVNWIITDNTDDWQRLRDSYLVPLGNKVIVLEGANENMGTTGDAQAYRQIKDWWNNILPSLPNLKIATNTGPTAACEIATAGSINSYIHFGNAHPYHFWPPFQPWGNVAHCAFNSTCAPPTISLWTAPDNNGGTIGYIDATRARRVAADKPMIFTEWGYPTISNDANGWGVSELTAAKYTARGFLEHFNAGIVYSCSYELMDPVAVIPFSPDPEKHFGLAYNDGTLKHSGTAVKRLIALLEDGGNTNIPTGTLNYTLSGGGLNFIDDKNATTNEIHQTLLQKANGKFYLVLWQEAISTNSGGDAVTIPAENVTVNFGETLIGLKAYLPTTTNNENPILDTVNVSSYTFSVPDHPLVIEITTGTASVTAPTVITTATSSITTTTASSGGNVTNGGSTSVTVRGVCWSTSINPTTALTTKTINGSSTGIFTSSITGLTPGTLYHVRAYATNSVSTSYGSNITFTTGSASGGSWTTIDDAAPGWTWVGFANDPCSACFNGTSHSVNSKNKTASYTFIGTNVEAFCETWSGAGSLKIYIDGVLKGTYSQNIAPYAGGQKFATITGLSNAAHTIKFLSTSTNWVGIDYIRFAVNPTAGSRAANSLSVLTAANDILSGNAVEIYPNPAGAFAFINLKNKLNSEGYFIEVTDVSGKRIFNSGKLGTESFYKLNMGKYAAGTYIVSVIRGKQKTNHKLVKN